MQWIKVGDGFPPQDKRIATIIKCHYLSLDNIILATGARTLNFRGEVEWDLKCCSCSYDAFTQYIDGESRIVTHWIDLEEFKSALAGILPEGLIPVGCCDDRE